jgi:serine/threonine-protein kinase
MTARDDRWPVVRQIMATVLAAAPAERNELLERLAGQDPALRAEVTEHLRWCDRAEESGFLAQPIAALAGQLLPDGTNDCLDDPSGVAADLARRTVQEAALRAALAERYDVEQEIGRGGTATVYLAHDHRHARPVALKVLHPALGATISLDRFLREIRVTAGLTHPHVLPLFDSGMVIGHQSSVVNDGATTDDQRPTTFLYYVMPYIEGETLRGRLAREGPMPLDSALRILREVAGALGYAHSHGVVHRDVKPANILLAAGHAVVADFGIARAMHQAREPALQDEQSTVEHGTGAGDTLTGAGISPGTPAYMAPEQAIPGAAVNFRAALYAFGLVAYEMPAGPPPLGLRPPAELLDLHATRTPVPLSQHRPDIPEELTELVMACLAKDPADRPPSADDLSVIIERMQPRVEPNAAVATPSAGLQSRRARRAMATAAIVIAAIGLTLGIPALRHAIVPSHLSADDGRGGGVHSVAVLPFTSGGGAADQHYLGDGLADELTSSLSRLPGLAVVGRTSSMTAQGGTPSARTIGRTLNVEAVVSGTLQRAGDRLRVSAQLIRSADNRVIWDSVFDSHARNLFAVQDELTHSIAAAIEPMLGEHDAGDSALRPRRGTADQEAYDLYLKGRYYWMQRGPGNIVQAISFFRQAVRRAPGFARARAGLALAYALLPVYVADPTDSAMPLAVSSAQRALALDSTLSDAHLALGLAFETELQLPAALGQYRMAMSLDPSSVTAHHWLGYCLLNLGRTDEALIHLRRATALDPLATAPASAVATALLYARHFADARVAARHALALDSTFGFASWTLGLAQALDGQADSAVQTLEHGTMLQPSDLRLRTALLFAYAAAGRWDDATIVRNGLGDADQAFADGTEEAFADLVFGDRASLVSVLASAPGARRYLRSGGAIGCNPLFDPLWTDARFGAEMRRLGLEKCGLVRPWPVRVPAAHS